MIQMPLVELVQVFAQYLKKKTSYLNFAVEMKCQQSLVLMLGSVFEWREKKDELNFNLEKLLGKSIGQASVRG